MLKKWTKKRILPFFLIVIILSCACSNQAASKEDVNSPDNMEYSGSSTIPSDFKTLNHSDEAADGEEKTGTVEDRAIHMVMEGGKQRIPSRAESIELPDMEAENKEVSPIKAFEESAAANKEYTIMVYMIGSNLEYSDEMGYIGAATADIEEMLLSGVNFEKANLIVYAGGTVSWASGLPSYSNCVLDLSRYTGDGDLTKTIVAYQENCPSMGNPNTLASFVNYCSDHYPAEKTGLIFWDHGNGPLYGYGNDMLNNGDSLMLPEFRQAMEKTAYSGTDRLEFVGFDACLMASLENACVWSDYADYLIASEEKESELGWDYSFLSELNNTSDSEELVKKIVDTSALPLKEMYMDYTLSAMRLKMMPTVLKSFDRMFDYINNSGENILISLVRQRMGTKEFGKASAEEYVDSDLIDLKDFCEQLSETVPQQAEALKDSINKMILCNSSNMENAYGVSVYFPAREMPLYLSVFENYYNLVNPSETYAAYLHNYAKEWTNTSESFKDEELATTSEEYADTEESIIIPLSDTQLNNFAAAEYTVFEVHDEYYRPVLENVRVEPDENGVLAVPKDPVLLCYAEGDSGSCHVCRAFQIEQGDSREVYQVFNVTLLPDRRGEFGGEMQSVTFKVISTQDGEFETQDIQLLTDDPSGAGRQTPDLNHYEGLFFLSDSFEPVTAENGYYYPKSEWESTGSLWGTDSGFDGDFSFIWNNSSQFDENYAVQITYLDAFGSIGTSAVIPLEKDEGRFCGIQTDGGMLRFRLDGDHAVLTGYEGNDYSLEIPGEVKGKKVTIIEPYVFFENNGLREVSIPDTVFAIQEHAFSSCPNLKEVHFPDSLTEIGTSAFSGCSSLKSIILPEKIKILRDSVFSGCTALSSISIPAGLKTVGNGIFTYCTSLETIDVDPSCTACKMTNNLLLTDDGKTLIMAPQGGGTYIRIPEGVEKIGYAAFAGYSDLRIVEFPESLREIRNFAFYDCLSLDNIQFPERLESIGFSAFGRSSMDSIDEELNRKKGKPVKIGENVSYIGAFAFEGTRTEGIIVDENNKNYSSLGGVLMDKAGVMALEIPAGCISGKELKLPEGVMGIRNNLFRNAYFYYSVEDYYFPESLLYIMEDPFNDTIKESIKIHAKSGTMAEVYAQAIGVEFVAEQ